MNKKNPFKTPEGYFDNFATEFMAQLPEPGQDERRGKSLFFKLRPLLYAAACLMAVCFGGYLVWQNSQTIKQDATAAEYNKVHDQYVDDYLDCAMLDNGDIYACISE